MVYRRSTKFLFVFFISSLFSGNAWGRFYHGDEETIDREEVLGLETYNDRASYRYPPNFRKIFENESAVFQVNAGSLSQTRFDYLGEIKFRSSHESPLMLQFKSVQDEDRVEIRNQSELELSYRLPQNIRFGILGEGGTLKEYGDIGGLVGYYQNPNRFFEVYYWWVDGFYATKKSFPEDKHKRTPYTIGTRGEVWFDKTGVRWDISYDHPFRWYLKSRNFNYDYERTTTNVTLLHRRDDSEEFRLKTSFDHKYEKKTWFYTEQSKSIDRRVITSEFTHTRLLSAEYWEYGGALIYHQADSQYLGAGEEAETFEPISPDVERKEMGVFAHYGQPALDATGSFHQYGIYFNQVRIEEGQRLGNGELKLQYAFNYEFHPTGRLFINTTWDIDQIFSDLAKGNKTFRPWGGGNVQFQINF